MAQVVIEFSKTYASEANANRAVAKFPHLAAQRYILVPVIENGGVRYGVLFIGTKAVEAGAHFHFNVAA